jgi:hypothetical protein
MTNKPMKIPGPDHPISIAANPALKSVPDDGFIYSISMAEGAERPVAHTSSPSDLTSAKLPSDQPAKTTLFAGGNEGDVQKMAAGHFSN